jgi:hypothetical protein
MAAYDLDRVLGGDLTAVEFPAPWPRDVGRCTVSPDLSFAVYAGVHAVQAFDAGGGLRWEVGHRCWEGSCLRQHSAYEEFAGLDDHEYPESGSVCVSPDGKLVWAHVTGPLPADVPPEEHDPCNAYEQWLVLDAASGTLLARMRTDTAAGGSHQLPHPDPARMALNVGEGQDGSTTWLGRYHEGGIEGVLVGKEVILLGVAASGAHPGHRRSRIARRAEPAAVRGRLGHDNPGGVVGVPTRGPRRAGLDHDRGRLGGRAHRRHRDEHPRRQ